jgi:ribosomal protein S18 acetylase RimI-like enzyme
MNADPVAQVRSFDRTVTGAIGALDEGFLGRERSLGAARLLWEIGAQGAEVRALRRRLGLDSGYCSRLLRALERDGLVVVTRAPGDGRVRLAGLTEAGEAELAELDRRSDAAARALLGPLTAVDRDRLVTAMAEVERLLVRAQTTVVRVPAGSADVAACFGRFFAELDRRFATGFEVGRSRRANEADLTPPAGFVLLARLRDDPVGCGAVRLHAGRVAEIKHLWVDPRMRGQGLGRRLLSELERRAAERGAIMARLDTNSSLTEAVSLYRRTGYREVPRFNDEHYADRWFEKPLVGERASD